MPCHAEHVTDKADIICKWYLPACVVFFCLSAVFFVYFAVTAYAGKGVFDFVVFYNAAVDFEKTGILYPREHNYAVNLSVYKFPPLTAAVLALGYRLGLSYEQFLDCAFFLHVFCYLSALALLVCHEFGDKYGSGLSDVLRSGAVGLFLYPLLDTNIIRLQIDVYVLFFLSLSIFLLSKKRDYLAGSAIAVAAALKVYPLVLLAIFLVWRKFRVVLGFGAGLIFCCVFTVIILGWDENAFFVSYVLPILLQELPAGGGDGNISLPTMMFGVVIPLYIYPYAGTFSPEKVLALVADGTIREDVIFRYVEELRLILKVFSSVATLGFLFCVAVMRSRMMNLKYSPEALEVVLFYSYLSFIVMVVLFLPNSWINYQVLLLLPIVFFMKHWKSFGKYFRWWLVIVIVVLWLGASLDATQERVNNYIPGTVPLPLVDITKHIPGLTDMTRWMRCLAAVMLFCGSVYLVARLSARKTSAYRLASSPLFVDHHPGF